MTFGAAILGMSVGGWMSDRMAKSRPEALFIVPGVAMLGSIPFVLAALFSTRERTIFAAIFVAEVLMFINTGPCNAIVANVVQPNLRAAAFAISIFFLHFLGDIWSPWLIGKAADLFGDPVMMASVVGQALRAIGAVPTQVSGHPPENIIAGLLVVVPALLLSGVVLLAGAPPPTPRDGADAGQARGRAPDESDGCGHVGFVKCARRVGGFFSRF